MSGGECGLQLISPATTPGSTQDEEKCLTEPIRPADTYKEKWKSPAWTLIPCYMITLSIVQVLIYLLADDTTIKLLRFEPSLRWEAWRFTTYMLAHWGNTHLILNVVIQCFLAVCLEVEQGGLRTLAVYIGGGVFGALGACILQPQPMVGASAGIYALLISHLAHLYLNFNSLKYKIYRLFAVSVLLGSDIAFCIFHTSTDGHPSISLSAHATGGLSGILLGLVFYRALDLPKKCNHRRVAFWVALILTFVLFSFCVVLVVMLPSKFFRR